jgi:exopolyphosphatase/pppGpp-phosphohydrolase
MLQFAGQAVGICRPWAQPGSAREVLRYAAELRDGLTATARRLRRAAALFHDIGNVLDRERHHLISETIIGELTARRLHFTPTEARLVGLLCRWHRRDYDAARIEMLRGEAVRVGLAALPLRVSDAMDIDSYAFFSRLRPRPACCFSPSG